MKDPFISIITPVRNGARYLEECIQSVLNQKYSYLEHVIVDGASTDGTLEILKRYSSQHPERIRFISEPDKGAGEAWNKGFKLARGDIFNCLGADDLCEPGAIQIVADFFRFHPEAFFLYGEDYRIDEKGEIIGHHPVEEFNYQDFVNTARHISTISSFYRKEVIEKVGGVNQMGDDFDLMLRIAKKFQMNGLNKILSRLRLHSDSFYSCSDLNRRLETAKITYVVSRSHGGRMFSEIGRLYHFCLLLKLVHLHRFFPSIKKIFLKWKSISLKPIS